MDIDSAMQCVQDFIDTGHKSMYLMDAWITIMDYVMAHEKGKK